MKVRAVIFAVILAAVLILLPACSANSGESIAFGSFYTISIKGAGAAKTIKSAKALLVEIENQCSTNIKTSDIAKINAAEKNEPIAVGAHTLALFKLSKELYEQTDSAFNAAIFPLVELWNFAPHNYIMVQKSIPSQEQIDLVLSHCSMELFLLDESSGTITKTNDKAKLDFGAVAKGYAADKVRELVTQKDFIINIGGTISCGKEKRVGITNPRSTSSLIGTIEMGNSSVSTSGDYERNYSVGGKNYHHILDSVTGAPTQTFFSVSVLGESAALCDAYSTAIMVKGKDFAETLVAKGYNCITIGDSGIETTGGANVNR